MSHLESYDEIETEIELNILKMQPWAIFECKRVGIEEGLKKGPQTIEKAKQGAYVARTLSSLQKIRMPNGQLGGLIYLQDGSYLIDYHSRLIEQIVHSESFELLRQFSLSVGVVSNHGNWFTGANKNKELEVLGASYDWLIFLTDMGLTEFIRELLLDPTPKLAPARNAFLASYAQGKKKNRFTKVQMDLTADSVLQRYFSDNHDRIQGWFNVISPVTENLTTLQKQLAILRSKDWLNIHN